MNIYKALITISKEVGAIGKTSVNKTQGFAYRGIDSVMNALSPIMAKNNVIAVPEVLEMQREERQTKNGGNLIYTTLKVKYTFIADDGSSVSAVVIGEGMDSGDKSSNKALSVAFKYACFQIFCIPTEEMIDADSESHEVVGKQEKQETTKVQDVSNGKISKVKLQALIAKCGDGRKPEEVLKITKEIIRLYKVENLQDLTELQHVNIINNFEKICEKAGV
jgi:hypothetical protein